METYQALAETLLKMHKMIFDITEGSRSPVQREVNDIAFAAISAYAAMAPKAESDKATAH
jgi:hypothetical protein